MNDEIKRGDIVLVRTLFKFTSVMIVNKILKDGSIFVDNYLWSGDDYMIRNCRRVTKDKIIKIL